VVKTTSSSAFTLLELIFAIVIIALAVVTLPRMSQISSQGIENSFAQEAVFAASAALEQASSGRWDLNSLEANTSIARVIDIAGNCNSHGTDYLLQGHINQPKHRRCKDDSTTGVANIAGDANNTTLESADTAGIGPLYNNWIASVDGYKKSYNHTIVVTPVIGNADLKQITISVLDPNSNPPNAVVTVLRTFSANVGEVDFHYRPYP